MAGIRKIELDSLGKIYTLNVPEKNLILFHKPQAAPLSEPRSRVEEALAAPLGSLPLAEAARGTENAAVVIDDWGRSDTTRRIAAPAVLDHLNSAGIKDDKITVVIARGLGLAPSMELIEETFGPELMRRNVHKHISALHPSGHKFFGFSRYGTPVWIDRRVADADFVVGIGSVFPSPWGGWSGGSKIIVPGVASSDTICHNHSMMIRVKQGSWDHPGLKDREEIANMCGLKFLVNLVLTPEGEIAAVEAGEMLQTHRHMAKAFLDLYTVYLPSKPDVVVTTIGWWQSTQAPMDSLYGFVDQSLPSLSRIADPGATIICTGRAPGGIWAGMREYMRTVYTLEDLASLRYKGGTIGFVSVLQGIQFKLCQAEYRMIMAVEGIGDGTLADMGFETASSPDEALQMALSGYGVKAKVAVLPAMGCPNWPEIKSK